MGVYDVIGHEKHLSFWGKVSLLLFFLLAVVLWSPVFPGVFGLQTAYIYLPLMLLLCCTLYFWKGVVTSDLLVFLFLLSCVLIFLL